MYSTDGSESRPCLICLPVCLYRFVIPSEVEESHIDCRSCRCPERQARAFGINLSLPPVTAAATTISQRDVSTSLDMTGLLTKDESC
jgi:hypothetical protein